MNWLSKISEYYPDRWGKERVANAVVKGHITDTDYEDIVGEPYPGGQQTYNFTGMTADEVVRSLSYRPKLDELRQACDWLQLPRDEKMTRAQLRALIDEAAAAA